MLAPVIFVLINGKRICIDAWDVCSVVEKAVGTEITYMPTNEPDLFVTHADFDQVVENLQTARNREPRKHNDGDEWKNGDYDED